MGGWWRPFSACRVWLYRTTICTATRLLSSGIGQLCSSIVALVVTVAFKKSFIDIKNATVCDYACQIAADRSWRIIVGFGALPACFALYYRITIPETPRYTFDVAHDVEKADADIRAYMASQNEGEVDIVQQARSE